MRIAHAREKIVFAGLIVFSIVFLLVGNRVAMRGNAYFGGASSAQDYYRARVLAATGPVRETQQIGGYPVESQVFDLQVKLLEGFMEGETIEITGQRVEQNSSVRVYPYRVGDTLYVSFDFDGNGNPVWYASDHARDEPLVMLVAGFLLLLVLFGRRQGARTVVTLVFTVSSIFLIMAPAILKGMDIYILTFLVASYIVVMTLGIVSGVSVKSAAAAAGCIGGIFVAGMLALAMQDVMKISGMVNEEASFVLLINPEHPIDLQGVLFAAIVIGALGAVMDVAMSIASSLEELLVYDSERTCAELFHSGIKIGRDIMGTMANTLILAYVGSSLNIILLLTAYNRTPSAILNREMVAAEVLQAVAGSVGILCAVPATALVTAWFHHRRQKAAHR